MSKLYVVLATGLVVCQGVVASDVKIEQEVADVSHLKTAEQILDYLNREEIVKKVKTSMHEHSAVYHELLRTILLEDAVQKEDQNSFKSNQKEDQNSSKLNQKKGQGLPRASLADLLYSSKYKALRQDIMDNNPKLLECRRNYLENVKNPIGFTLLHAMAAIGTDKRRRADTLFEALLSFRYNVFDTINGDDQSHAAQMYDSVGADKNIKVNGFTAHDLLMARRNRAKL